MGQKVNPKSFRLIINKDWQSKWFGKKDFAENVAIDHKIRSVLAKKFGKTSGIGKLEILRDADSITVNIYTSRPGVIIGRSGQGINEIRAYIIKNVDVFRVMSSNKLPKIKIEIIELKNPEGIAQLIADSIAIQIEKRIAYKRAIKQAIAKAVDARVKGIKVKVSGRLGGSEIARNEKYGEKSVPLGRLRAQVDYGYSVAMTTYGTIGVKVWIYKGERIGEE